MKGLAKMTSKVPYESGIGREKGEDDSRTLEGSPDKRR